MTTSKTQVVAVPILFEAIGEGYIRACIEYQIDTSNISLQKDKINKYEKLIAIAESIKNTSVILNGYILYEKDNNFNNNELAIVIHGKKLEKANTNEIEKFRKKLKSKKLICVLRNFNKFLNQDGCIIISSNPRSLKILRYDKNYILIND